MRNIIYGIIAGILLFLALAIPTSLLPTGLFIRMTETVIFDYIFLFTVPILFGVFITLHLKNRQTLTNKKTCTIGSSLLAGWLAVSCPTCIGFLVVIFGASTLLSYFDPLRTVFGALSVVILVLLICSQRKNILRGNNGKK